MRASRRTFLAGLGGIAAGAAIPSARATPRAGYLACAKAADGSFFVAGLNAIGGTVFELRLPGRGHAGAIHPTTGEAVVFARRAGTFAYVLDPQRGTMLHRLGSPSGRHFYGHGAFSVDGRLLFSTENNFHVGTGVLGIYDVRQGYRRIAELPTDGIGPHQILLLPDGKTLAVANGGILTHPDTGRSKLNIGTMASSLVLIDTGSRQTVSGVRLDRGLHKLSIRHIDASPEGVIAFGMQYEGDRRDEVPLVGLHDRSGTRFLRPPRAAERRMHQYTGSVAFDRSGEWLAVSSPRGHCVAIWNARTENFAGLVEARDASGLAAASGTGVFLVTSGDGTVHQIQALSCTARTLQTTLNVIAWDNHVIEIPVG